MCNSLAVVAWLPHYSLPQSRKSNAKVSTTKHTIESLGSLAVVRLDPVNFCLLGQYLNQ